LEPLVASHRGRIFKIAGDGVLIEFTSAAHAVQCAIDLQHGKTLANGEIPEDRRIVLRIGINLGDVMVEGSNLHGDGVNKAFEDLGPQSLKNMAEAVRVYRVSTALASGEASCLAGPSWHRSSPLPSCPSST
jgi:class 3 adenylate cyclase